MFGWNEHFQEVYEAYNDNSLLPARVIREEKGSYIVNTGNQEISAEISGKLRFKTVHLKDFPSVGDWVLIKPINDDTHSIIYHVLERESYFARKVPISGGRKVREIRGREIVLGVDICPISALNVESLDEIKKYIQYGKTIGIFGSSGVGKSTLINGLIAHNQLATSDVRSKDSKGRHTTTWREMVVLNSGGILIDTPGMRELQIWTDNEHLSTQFSDIEGLFSLCKFNNCTHTHEPGCEVIQALNDGRLDADRYNNYLQLLSETSYLDERRREKESRLLFRKYHGKQEKDMMKNK